MAPRISVVVPTYNRARYLEETLESVFAQTFTDFEVVVVDDGSTDDTPSRLARHAGRIRVIRQENRGMGRARNRGIAAARARYVALLDDDDLWHPRKLEVQYAFMASHPRLVGCSVPFCFSTAPGKAAFDPALCSDDGEVRDALRKYTSGQLFVLNSVAMFDMEKLGDLRFDPAPGIMDDIPFNIRLLLRGPYGIAGREVLATYRIHASNGSRSASQLHWGMRKLRELQARDGYGARTADEAHAIDGFLSTLGRNMMMAQLSVGERRRAVGSYAAEFRYQLRQRRFKFLSLYPLLLLAPARLINRVPSFRATP